MILYCPLEQGVELHKLRAVMVVLWPVSDTAFRGETPPGPPHPAHFPVTVRSPLTVTGTLKVFADAVSFSCGF